MQARDTEAIGPGNRTDQGDRNKKREKEHKLFRSLNTTHQPSFRQKNRFESFSFSFCFQGEAKVGRSPYGLRSD